MVWREQEHCMGLTVTVAGVCLCYHDYMHVTVVRTCSCYYMDLVGVAGSHQLFVANGDGKNNPRMYKFTVESSFVQVAPIKQKRSQ